MHQNSDALHLETSRLLLRRWRPEDFAPFAHMNADPDVMRYFPHQLAHAETEALIDRFETHFRLHGFGFFAAELKATRAFIGVIGISRSTYEDGDNPSIEIGWRVDSPYWNQGFATEGARASMNLAFHTLQIPALIAITTPGNLASRRVMEKLGMTRDPSDDFDHPRVPPGHPLRLHVLYRLSAP